MKRRQPHRFAALARGLHHAAFHLTRGFLRECQPKNVFAGEGFIRLQQVPDAFRDDARLSGSRPRNHQQRSFTVRDRAPLRIVEFQPALPKRFHLKQSCHRLEGYRILIEDETARDCLLYRVEDLLPGDALVGGNKANVCVQSPDPQRLVGRDWNALVSRLLGLKNDATPGPTSRYDQLLQERVRKLVSAQVTGDSSFR